MEQYTLHAYESMGLWHITMGRDVVRDDGQRSHDLIYRGDHVPIDDQDPLIRAVLILDQVASDLQEAIRGNLDILDVRPASH